MPRPLSGLVLAAVLVATSAESASLSASSWTATTSGSSKASKDQRAQTPIWDWLLGLISEPQMRAEATEQPITDGADHRENGVAGDDKATRKTNRNDRKQAERDDAREKAGPEPLPMAF